jgi:hypothetical protein
MLHGERRLDRASRGPLSRPVSGFGHALLQASPLVLIVAHAFTP